MLGGFVLGYTKRPMSLNMHPLRSCAGTRIRQSNGEAEYGDTRIPQASIRADSVVMRLFGSLTIILDEKCIEAQICVTEHWRPSIPMPYEALRALVTSHTEGTCLLHPKSIGRPGQVWPVQVMSIRNPELTCGLPRRPEVLVIESAPSMCNSLTQKDPTQRKAACSTEGLVCQC